MWWIWKYDNYKNNKRDDVDNNDHKVDLYLNVVIIAQWDGCELCIECTLNDNGYRVN